MLREESDAFDGVAIGDHSRSQPEIGDAARGRAERVVTAGLDDGDVSRRGGKCEPDGAGRSSSDPVKLTRRFAGFTISRTRCWRSPLAKLRHSDDVSGGGD